MGLGSVELGIIDYGSTTVDPGGSTWGTLAPIQVDILSTLLANSRLTTLGFNNNGMTAATSEYAMLDSMFAMDPVFPGLGGLDTLDQQFMDPNWGNSGLPSLPQPQHQQQANPIHPNFSTSLPSQNQTPHQSQPQQQMHPRTNESSDTLLPTPPSFDLPNSPWTTWLSGQGQAQTLEDGMMAGGLIASGGNKRTMSSSEVYKKVTKP
jgi:hypothetical protein